MKKMSILFFASMLFFFSCATSGEVSKSDSLFEASPQNAEIENSLSQNSENEIAESEISDAQSDENEIAESEIEEIKIPEEADEAEIAESEILAEKISQEELDEWEGLLAQAEIPKSEIVIPDDDFGAEEEIEYDVEIAEEEILQEPLVDEEEPEIAVDDEIPETEFPENEIPAPNEDVRSDEMAADFPVQEGPSRENAKNEPPLRNGLSEAYDFSGEEIADSESENLESEIPEAAETESVIPSRTMSVKRNQYVDIVYPGSGWIYLGEADGAEHFSFHGRTLDDEECTFTLRSKKSGNAILHFYKNDALTGNYIDDYIAIEIGEEIATDSSHVLAPSYALAVPKKFERDSETVSDDGGGDLQDSDGGEKSVSDDDSGSKPKEDGPFSAEGENRPAERVQTVIQDSQKNSQDNAGVTSVAGVENSASAQEKASSSPAQNGESAQGSANAASLLEMAQKAYDEKRYADALSLLRRFFEAATSDFDAGLYLQGLVLEADSEVRDIKSAIASYDTVVKNFPQSTFWTRANERGIYLKRFYIDIR